MDKEIMDKLRLLLLGEIIQLKNMIEHAQSFEEMRDMELTIKIENLEKIKKLWKQK